MFRRLLSSVLLLAAGSSLIAEDWESYLARVDTSLVSQSIGHDYAAHHAAAQRTGRLVVLVSANYCYSCRTQKAALNAVGEPYAILDVGSPEARRMLGDDRSIPQTIVYERRGGKWTSRKLRGSWDVGRVREFVGGVAKISQPERQP